MTELMIEHPNGKIEKVKWNGEHSISIGTTSTAFTFEDESAVKVTIQN